MRVTIVGVAVRAWAAARVKYVALAMLAVRKVLVMLNGAYVAWAAVTERQVLETLASAVSGAYVARAADVDRYVPLMLVRADSGAYVACAAVIERQVLDKLVMEAAVRDR